MILVYLSKIRILSSLASFLSLHSFLNVLKLLVYTVLDLLFQALRRFSLMNYVIKLPVNPCLLSPK